MITPEELQTALRTSPKAANRMAKMAIEQYDAEINTLAKWRKDAEAIVKETEPQKVSA